MLAYAPSYVFQFRGEWYHFEHVLYFTRKDAKSQEKKLHILMVVVVKLLFEGGKCYIRI